MLEGRQSRMSCDSFISDSRPRPTEKLCRKKHPKMIRKFFKIIGLDQSRTLVIVESARGPEGGLKQAGEIGHLTDTVPGIKRDDWSLGRISKVGRSRLSTR